MKVMFGIALIASISLVVVGVALAVGTTYTLEVNHGEWDDPASWGEATEYPGSEDTAIIPHGMDVQILGAHHVKVLKLQKSGTSIGVARIRGAASLTLHGSSGELDGHIRFERDDSDNGGGELIITENLTLTGSGKIVGHHETHDPGGEIDWTPGLIRDDNNGKVLTIEGSPNPLDLQIEGSVVVSVELENNSLVYVGAPFDTVSLTDHPKSGTGDWWVELGGRLIVNVRVSGPGNWRMLGSPSLGRVSVQINAACTSLTGGVQVLDEAVLDVNANFSTTGYTAFGDVFPASSASEIRVAPGTVAQFSIPGP